MRGNRRPSGLMILADELCSEADVQAKHMRKRRKVSVGLSRAPHVTGNTFPPMCPTTQALCAL
jgi:hypothetical protein